MTNNASVSEPKSHGPNTDYLWLAVPPGKQPHLGRRLFQPGLRAVLGLMVKVTIVGIENFPMQGPAIAIYNHMHYLDPNILASRMPRYTVPLSKEENFSVPVQGWLLYAYGAIGVKRGEIDRVALRAAQAVLEAGNALMIAPEGTRSRANTLQEAREGLVFIARSVAGTVIQPVGQWGLDQFGENLKHLRRTPVTIRFGRPFQFRKMQKRSREALRQMTDEAMYQLAGLLPPAYRGVYSDASKATTEWIEFI